MNLKRTILVVEDEASIGSFISSILSANGYGVLRAKNGTEAMSAITSHCPDLVILDLGLPDIDGTEIIQKVRQWSRVPIIVVSARTHERDKIQTLDMGADDYITKPFGSGELLARVRTAFRHMPLPLMQSESSGPCGSFTCGALHIDYDKMRVYVDGTDARLTQIEYKIVSLLSQYAGKVLTHDYIIKSVWGPNFSGDNQILRVNMANIRRKIESNPADPKYIFTEIGVGYRMEDGD